MSQTLPATIDDRMIFLPSETLSQRVVEAEKKVDDLRKQRSRSLMFAVVNGVGFLACLLMIGGILMFMTGQIESARGQAQILVDDTKKERDEVLARIGEELQRKDDVVRIADAKMDEMERIELIGLINAMYQYEHERSELNKMVLHYGSPEQKPSETGWLAFVEKLNLAAVPPSWEFDQPIGRDTWVKELTDAYQKDALEVNKSADKIKFWAEPKPLKKFVESRRADPWAENSNP